MNWGYEESYTILNGGTTLVTSAAFADYEQRTDEYCLPATTNNQYSFNITDTYGDSWTSGSWVSIAGIYGNVFFKNYMTEKRDELFPLSLYYPIMKNQQWKMFSSTSSIASDWFAVNFSDGNWQQVTLGSATPVTGTQYFRKQFAGITGMAAYEARFNYRYGIIAYMNGVEIFRDHMPEGAVTPSTGSIGAYDAYEYHGVIRPAGEAESTNNVLAVELHFTNAGSENAVEFDAFVASIAPSIQASENTKCFIYPYGATITATGGSSPGNIFDFTKYNSYKNPSVYNGAVEYVSICIFERIFGIAFVQQFADPAAQAEVDWESFTPPSAKDSRRDWLNIGDMSVVELAYAVSDLIKSSGRGDFFKSAGKTRFVFLMVGVAARREA